VAGDDDGLGVVQRGEAVVGYPDGHRERPRPVGLRRCPGEGARDRVVDFQVPCGPALGAFNQWVQGGQWEKNWRARHPGAIAARLMKETAVLLSLRLRQLTGSLTTPN